MTLAEIKDLERFVGKLGFGQYKRQVFTALFRLQEASIQEIGKVSKVPQPKIYGILHELEDEGFASLVLTKPRRYRMVHPEVIFEKIIGERQEQLRELEDDRKRMGHLFEAFGKPDGDQLELMQGREKVLHFLTNELKHNATKSYLAVVAFNSVSTPLMSIMEKKIKQGMDIRVVGAMGRDFVVKKYLRLGVKVRIINDIQEPIRFSVYDGNRLAFTLAGKERDYITVWTDSPPLVSNMTNLFQHYWDSGVEYEDNTKTD